MMDGTVRNTGLDDGFRRAHVVGSLRTPVNLKRASQATIQSIPSDGAHPLHRAQQVSTQRTYSYSADGTQKPTNDTSRHPEHLYLASRRLQA